MTIVFDDDCISKYVEEMSVVYGVTAHALWEIIDGENIENENNELKPKIRLPPWVSPIGQGVVDGAEVVGVGVGNVPIKMGVSVGK
jgi:hypothetical protein